MAVSDYYQKMKSFSDTLAAIGQPLQAHEFIAYLLGGLDSSYDAIVTSISTQVDKMSSEEMFNHLLAFELQIEQHHSALETTVGSANMATRHDGRSRSGRSPSQIRSSQQQHPHGFNYNYRGRGRGQRGRGGQPPNTSSNPRPTCTPPNMAAYLIAPSSSTDTNWYPDTGSTNHLTNDFRNLTVHSEPYNSTDQIHVGDGAGLLIKNIGFAISSSYQIQCYANILLISKTCRTPI
ncbi:hypothetical protein F0562_030391 [Nyssa sinensis]|uniref:Reverse transcriptase Ty1/copia-type domain-containing protein n=1 Tax=Nyssa sinensis TaxID=561372 RepID=A0A5J5AYQ4_9ASTE|nr:hypothetical protein F0562_030391 [Nyssa sinensis]